MDVLGELKRVRDGDFGPLTNEGAAKLNEICLHLAAVKARLEAAGRKAPDLYGEDVRVEPRVEAAISETTRAAAQKAADLNTRHLPGTPPFDKAPWTVDDAVHVAVIRYLEEVEKRYADRQKSAASA